MHTQTRRLVAVLVGLVPVPAALAQGGWTPPTLETSLNTPTSDIHPDLSFDGLTLHFASHRSGNSEIYSATRTAPAGRSGEGSRRAAT